MKNLPPARRIFQLLSKCLRENHRDQKSPKSFLFEMNSSQHGEPPMRIARLIFVGSIAVLAVLATPALARNSNSNPSNANAQKVDDKPASQGCHAYQQAHDGSWVQLPCQEVGPTSQAPTQHKSATRIPDEEAR
jgi:hypothetical protein